MPFVLFAFACGGGSGDGDDGDDSPTIDASTNIDADIPPGYARLIGRTWSLGPAQFDTYKCVRVTIPEDMYITGIMAQVSTGTHHTVLSIAGANGTSGPDGEQDCGVGTLGMVMLYASGVGTDPLEFPAGVGVHVAAGQQVHLNLHLFNASDYDISGESSILVRSQPTAPPTLAEMVFAGRFLFSIPPNNPPSGPQLPPDTEHPVQGGCTAGSNFTLFALWPHMHQLAVHQRFEIVRGGTPTVLHDDPFAFEEQRYYLESPEFQVQSGDQIRVTCRYINNTGSTVTFGDSSNQEMCFTGMYRYPAVDAGLFQCTDNPSF